MASNKFKTNIIAGITSIVVIIICFVSYIDPTVTKMKLQLNPSPTISYHNSIIVEKALGLSSEEFVKLLKQNSESYAKDGTERIDYSSGDIKIISYIGFGTVLYRNNKVERVDISILDYSNATNLYQEVKKQYGNPDLKYVYVESRQRDSSVRQYFAEVFLKAGYTFTFLDEKKVNGISKFVGGKYSIEQYKIEFIEDTNTSLKISMLEI
ncbi:MAG: hypothetical protein WCO06_06935 [Candidatus Roizmanbacteria bacterium]